MQAMKTIGLPDEEINSIFRIIATVLHLGTLRAGRARGRAAIPGLMARRPVAL